MTRTATLAALVFAAPGTLGAQAAPAPVTLVTDDSVEVAAYLWTGDGERRAVVIALHQGGANARGEYGPLVSRLLAESFDVLAPDLRSGGERWGARNATVDAREASADYCEALPDLRAALAWARTTRPDVRTVLWGSSFSAALALRVAAEGPAGLAAVLAFSPATGGPLAGCVGEEVSDRITVPVLVLRPAAEMNLEHVRAQMTTFRAQGHAIHVSAPGAHGSSMLDPDRVGAGTDRTWKVVLDFLHAAVP